MKKTLSLLATAFVLSSCGTTYYQMFEAEYASPPKESPDITIHYNLWSEGGNMAFSITNNTDKVLTILWDKSFFIINGLSVPYYDNTEHSESDGTSIRSRNDRDVVYGTASTTTKKQERTVMVAPHASFPFSTYHIQEKYLHASELDPTPTKKASDIRNYSQVDSPIRFSNFISYQVDGVPEAKVIRHDFYIRAVSNWHSANFAEAETWSRPEEGEPKMKYFEEAPMRFYVQYFSGGY